ncbi:MAG TPA: Wzz/FepE/Etk N-terminal domain-containing protein [Terriglobia bacterium]|nr:Wzz/FepE/Etk N-terminal domain-containing protein [Terriglobia bacterium]
MIGNREMSFEDYGRILRRRLRVILIPAVLGAIAGYLITLFLTPQYTSTSAILIERPTVPNNLVPTSTTDDLFTRLETMQEQIESRTRLQPLIERYDLYKSERKTSMEDAVDSMRKSIDVRQISFENGLSKNSREQPVPGFSIGFTADNPGVAQQVTAELTSMFMHENLQQHEDMAKGTEDFLTNQLQDARRALDDQDAKLAEFKRKNLGALPDDAQTNLQVLASINTRLAAVTEELNRAEQDKAYTQSLLTQQEAAWKAAGSQTGTGPSATETLQDELSKMKAELSVMQGRYTEDYPDVVKLKSNIADLEKQIAAGKNAPAATTPANAAATTGTAAQNRAPADAATAAPGSPAPTTGSAQAEDGATPASIQQLRARLRQGDIFLKSETQEQAKLQAQARAYESRLQVTPAVEEEFKQLSMGHEQALKFYNDLLASRDQSQMSVDLESRGQGEQLRVLDSADLPQAPSFPVWWEFAVGGLAGGLALGLGIATLYELRDKALRDERDIEFYLQLPTLALVPSIGIIDGANGRSFRKGRKKPPQLQTAGAGTKFVS